MLLRIKKTHEDATIPKYQTKGSAGFDLHAIEDRAMIPGGTYTIRTGLQFKIPEGYELQIRPRSGLSLNTGLRVVNSPGTIDEDFSSEVMVILQNTSPETYVIKQGDRIAQVVMAKVYQAVFFEVQTIEDTGRGGLGSTGK